MPSGWPMKNNFFCFASIDSKLISDRPRTDVIFLGDVN